MNINTIKQIIELRLDGLSYREIAKIIPIAISSMCESVDRNKALLEKIKGEREAKLNKEIEEASLKWKKLYDEELKKGAKGNEELLMMRLGEISGCFFASDNIFLQMCATMENAGLCFEELKEEFLKERKIKIPNKKYYELLKEKK